ncbi:MAG: hypothetical protein J6S23_02690 [Clostridia bacterium]|nr:hypothetical protein [Clostridia bacterium]
MKIFIRDDSLKVKAVTGEQVDDLQKVVILLELDSKADYLSETVVLTGDRRDLYAVLNVLAKKYDIELI